MNGKLTEDQFYAQSVLNSIEGFITEFETRGELSKLLEILEKDTADLVGGIVGQKPERFTESKLIQPMLRSLGFDEITSQPADLVPDERRRPDFLLDGVDKRCVCIVEAKRFGRLNEGAGDSNLAEKEIQKYLSENALAKYRRDLSVRFLIGIATDGLLWTTFAKNLKTGTQGNVNGPCSLNKTFKQVVLARQYPETVDDRWRVTERDRIQDDFIATFISDVVVRNAIEALESN